VRVRARSTTTVDVAVFADNDGSGNAALYYAGCTANCYSGGFASPAQFSFAEVDKSVADVGRFATVNFLPAGGSANAGTNPVLITAYRDRTDKVLKTASCTSSTATFCNSAAHWTTSVVPDAASADYGRALSLAVDSGGAPRIAYFDASNNKIRIVAGNAQGVFSKTTEFPQSASPVGISLAAGSGIFAGYATASSPFVQVFAGP
jgi:hypothetical protein